MPSADCDDAIFLMALRGNCGLMRRCGLIKIVAVQVKATCRPTTCYPLIINENRGNPQISIKKLIVKPGCFTYSARLCTVFGARVNCFCPAKRMKNAMNIIAGGTKK